MVNQKKIEEVFERPGRPNAETEDLYNICCAIAGRDLCPAQKCIAASAGMVIFTHSAVTVCPEWPTCPCDRAIIMHISKSCNIACTLAFAYLLPSSGWPCPDCTLT
jgi:hypothetical protein